MLLVSAATASACNHVGPDVAARGSASIAWSQTMADRPVTCARAGAVSVSLLLHPRGGDDITTTFACADGEGTTPPVLAGPYDATLTLRAADGTVIATAPTQANVTVGADLVTALAPVEFVSADRGTLVVSFTAIGTLANCSGPQGLNGISIKMEAAAGACAAVTFARARGATQLGTYTVDCGSPVITTCIERDETLTATDVPSGAYVVHVIGFNGARRCRAEDDVLSVAAGGAITTKLVQLAPTRAFGC